MAILFLMYPTHDRFRRLAKRRHSKYAVSITNVRLVQVNLLNYTTTRLRYSEI